MHNRHKLQQGNFWLRIGILHFIIRSVNDWITWESPESLGNLHLLRYSKSIWAIPWATWVNFEYGPALDRGWNRHLQNRLQPQSFASSCHFQDKIRLTISLLWEDLGGDPCIPGQVQLHGGKEHFQISSSANLAASLKTTHMADVVLQGISVSKHHRERRKERTPESNSP